MTKQYTEQFRRPMSHLDVEAAVEDTRTKLQRGFLETARQELRDTCAALDDVRHKGELVWESPEATFALQPIAESLTSTLALLDELKV